MTVVRNELERGQNEPTEVLDEAVYAAAFREHPYHHPTIGWRADVEGVPTTRLKAFYDTFYHPNNATTIVVGDFERQRVLDLIDKYFGAYPPSSDPIPEVYTEEPPQQGERRLVIRRVGELAVVQIAFHTPGVLGQMGVLSSEELARRAAEPPAENDIYPLVVLSVALSHGITSRLYQALVETQLAVHVYTNTDQHRDPGLFNAVAMVTPGVEPKEVEEVILTELERVAREGMTDSEVEKARQQIIAQQAYSSDGTYAIAVLLSEAEAIADWRFYNDYTRNIARVTASDVQRVARAYLTEDNRTVGHFIPKQTGGDAGGGVGGNRNGSENGDGDGDGAHAAPRSLVAPHPLGTPRAPLARLFPRGVKFYDEPEGEESGAQFEAGRGAGDAADASVEAGGSTTPQDTEQQSLAGGRGRKSSDAAEANTPKSVGRSDFASRVSRTELETGATLLVLENHATATVSVRGSLRAGSYFEPRKKPGLASLVAGMLERGTKRRDKLQLASLLESVGAELDFSTDPFAVNFAARSLSKDLPLLIETLAEELREPSFPDDELEKLKQQTIAAIQEQQANTRYRGYERFTGLVFDEEHPFYVAPGERLTESISSVTVEEVRAFYEKYYGGRSLILVVAGDVDATDVSPRALT
jgi:zinc protease